MPRGGPTIAATVLRLLHERGPQHLDALVPEIVRSGLTSARDPRRAVAAAIQAKADFLRDWEGRWCSLVDQLEGAMVTLRPTSLERRDGIVILADQLALLERLLITPRPFVRGGEVHLDFVHDFFDLPWPHEEDGRDEVLDRVGPELAVELTGFLHELGVPYDADHDEALFEFLEASRFRRLIDGPPGWLPPLGDDDLLGIRVRGGAIDTLAVGRREVRGPHVGIVAAQVAKLARLVIGPDPSWFGPPVISIEELLLLVATEKPELLHRPTPPFSELVARGGLEVVGSLVGHRGTDWDALGWSLEAPIQDAWGYRPARTTH